MDIKSATSGLPTQLVDALKRNAAAQRAAPAAAPTAAPTAAPAGDSVSFSGALDQALRTVSASQAQASELAQAFQLDPSSTSLEQAMVASQKAQIGFQSALHVRNRLVSAYTDIMNMQV